MIVKRGKGDFHQTYRPCRLSEVVGNDEVKRVIEQAFKENNVPHSFLFHGLSGTGKTTIARIIEMGLNCAEGPTSEPCCECDYCRRIINRSGSLAVREINAGLFLKDQLKEILRDFHGYNSGAIEGLDKSIFLVDECHGLTGEQAGLFLKYVEEVPEWNYFVFCTTDPDKVLHTLRKRCVIQVEFDKVPETEIMKLLIEICEQEKIQPDEEVLRGIVERSAGLPRIAVNELQQSSLAGNLKKKRIQTLSGNNNTLVIAPHGHPKDDFNTGEIARRMHDKFGCYAVINEEYQKPESAGLDKPDVSNGTADLYDWNHINDFSELKEDFLHPVEDFKKKILAKHQSVTIIHIHGIDNRNIRRVARIIGGYKNKPDNLHVLVGYGQKANDNSRHTTDLRKFVHPLIKEIEGDDLRIEIAPTTAIIGVDGKEKLYCGNDPDRLNQRLCEPKDKVQSIQLEIKKHGFRKDKKQAHETADRLGMALSKIVKVEQQKPNHENKKGIADNINLTQDQPTKIETKKISTLNPHPLNQKIYGEPDPDDDLKHSIQEKGILTPLLISSDDRILSGHRRYFCAKESGIENVPVIVSPLKNELEIEETLINANIQRQKTKEQIAREYMKLKEIEKEKAKQRQAEAGGDRKSNEFRKSQVQNSAQVISKGKSRNKASSKLGISHDTGEKAAKVVLMADDLKKAGKVNEARCLLDTLNNKSVNKAHKEAQTIEGNYTVVKLRERIRDIKGKNPLSLDGNVTEITALRKLEPPQLIDLKEATQNRINKLFDELNLYQKRLEKISSVINQREIVKGAEQGAKGGFRDWTEPKNNVNICTGCENDCIYCYAKSMAYRFGQVKEGRWHEMIIRQKDVDQGRKLHNGIVGFPSSHDILPTNIDAYLNVLGKLLRSGNEVLVVSKPHLDCIKRICEASQFFKDKVLFRFTIGAMNDDILSYWEPNAPTYDERKTCLKYAFHWDFRTSVSMEPMLDSPNIKILVEDLLPFVTEDIWLGTMNHLSRIKKGADKRLLSELETIEAGQTPERLLTIDKIIENNPVIKWKTEALKIIEGAKERGKGAEKVG